MRAFLLAGALLFASPCLASDEPPVMQKVSAWTPTWYPPGKGPESGTERAIRWRAIVDVVLDESDGSLFWRSDMAALVLSTFKFESALDYHVHGGEPSPIGHQDNGRARCLGQIQHVRAWWTETEWKALAGRDEAATRRCARAAMRIYEYHAKRCLRRGVSPSKRWRARLTKDEASILMAAYGTGTRCAPLKWMRKRVTLFDRLRAVI